LRRIAGLFNEKRAQNPAKPDGFAVDLAKSDRLLE